MSIAPAAALRISCLKNYLIRFSDCGWTHYIIRAISLFDFRYSTLIIPSVQYGRNIYLGLPIMTMLLFPCIGRYTTPRRLFAASTTIPSPA